MAVHESTGAIRVLYRDESIVIIDKPPAMLTHSNSFDRHSPTVVMVLGSLLGQSIHNVHRLDRMTTGAMGLARTPEAARELSRQFREREVQKRYLAVVRGHLDERGTVESPIRSDRDQEEREARTDYQTLGRGRVDQPIGKFEKAWFSLVALELHTGRSHQARRHMHRISHPVIGDNKHGDKAYNRWAWNQLGEKHLFLRACELSFRHPGHGGEVRVRLALPDIWLRLLETIGIAPPEELTREDIFATSPGEG